MPDSWVKHDIFNEVIYRVYTFENKTEHVIESLRYTCLNPKIYVCNWLVDQHIDIRVLSELTTTQTLSRTGKLHNGFLYHCLTYYLCFDRDL